MASGGGIRQPDRQFTCPEEMLPHLKKTLEGEYGVPWEADKPCLVLDVGANCGAFTVWARLAWPNSEVDAYEPNPDMYRFLLANTEGLGGITPHQSAVGDVDLDKLFLGKHNPGESSQYQNGVEQTDESIEIEVVEPDTLLSYDIVKLDCEGAETYILPRLDLTQTKFVMFEYHSEQKRRLCDQVMADNGFTLIGITATAIGYGVAKYQRL